MWSAEAIVQALDEWGELWQSASGLVGLRGDAEKLCQALERRLADFARDEGAGEWRVPPAIPLSSLARADYFASFPQWLTTASHLRDDDVTLAAIAAADRPEERVAAALAPTTTALQPAVCYQIYDALAGRVLEEPLVVTAQGTCWRHEGDRLRPLERGWAFTMREIVCIGTSSEVEDFRQRMIMRVTRLAADLGLESALQLANDPFFAPTAYGRTLIQRLKALKHELMLPIGPVRQLAAASFNHHENFFGKAFDIRLVDGSPAASGCVAFGLERWLLAFLVQHGPDPVLWPPIETHVLS